MNSEYLTRLWNEIYLLQYSFMFASLQLASIESQLSQEQAMHIVSKTQLQSVDDENQRLRTQVASLRRRLASATHNESDR